MIADGEAVYCSPQAPSRPLPHVGVYLTSNYECYEITNVACNNGSATQISSVTYVAKQENYWESE